MKRISSYILVVFVLASMLLGACAGAPAATGGSKVEAIPVAYTGTIEGINGNQWTVNGLIITVDPSVVRDGPFNVGDTVKVEVNVNQDGTFTVTRIELPSSTDLSQLPSIGDDNSNADNSNDVNSNDGNANDANSNGVNSNDDNSNSVNSNDDNSNGNTNDDSGYSNDNNSNDDNSNVSNGNDDNSNDDSSNDNGGEDGGGGNDDSGGKDDGGGDDNNKDDNSNN